MVDKYMLELLSKAIVNKAKDATDEEKNRALAAEDEIRINVDTVENMLDGKSIRYITQLDYNALSEEEKHDRTVVYYIIDSENVDVTRAMTEYWDTKADGDVVEELVKMLNGYSIFIGSTEELSNIVERDSNTMYLELKDTVIEIFVDDDDNLVLNNNKYQKCVNVAHNIQVIFPKVYDYTNIHLFIDVEQDIDINFNAQATCKFTNIPPFYKGNTYEVIATYNTVYWLIDIKEYKTL